MKEIDNVLDVEYIESFDSEDYPFEDDWLEVVNKVIAFRNQL